MNAEWAQAINEFNLFQYLTEMGAKFDVEKNGTAYLMDCPKCYRHKLSVSNDPDRRGVFHCYKCNYNGSIIDLMMDVEDISRSLAIKKLLGNVAIRPTDKEVANLISMLKQFNIGNEQEYCLESNKSVEKPSGHILMQLLSHDHECWKYALNRGLTQMQIQKWKLCYSSYDQRLIFPVFENGNLTGWQGRDITGRSDWDKSYPKAMTGPSVNGGSGFKKRLTLYGLDFYRDQETITLVEGPMDAIKGEGVNSVALFGSSMSEEQFRLILSLPYLKNVVVALDADARVRAEEITAKLAPFFRKVLMVKLPDRVDFGCSDDIAIKRFVFDARPFQKTLCLTI